MQTPPTGRDARSASAVCGLKATNTSVTSRRAIYPSLLTRIVYQVGRPEIFDGNRFLPLTGMPILKSARINVEFAVWLPDPFTVAATIEKSLTTSGRPVADAGWG